MPADTLARAGSRPGFSGRAGRAAGIEGEDAGHVEDPQAMTTPHDQECLQRVQAGDAEALAELYDRFTPLLFGLALRIARDAAAAEGALEAAWLHVWRRAATYDPRRGSVAAWLAMIVRERSLERLRSGGARLAAGSPDSGAGAPFSNGAGEAVAQLEPRPREVLELAYFEGLPEGEIATRLGVGAEAVRSWTRQGLTQLRDLLPQEDWL